MKHSKLIILIAVIGLALGWFFFTTSTVNLIFMSGVKENISFQVLHNGNHIHKDSVGYASVFHHSFKFETSNGTNKITVKNGDLDINASFEFFTFKNQWIVIVFTEDSTSNKINVSFGKHNLPFYPS